MHEHHPDCHCSHEESENRYEKALSEYNFHLHDEEIQAAAEHLLAHRLAAYDTPEIRASLPAFYDVTSLKVTDTEESILALVERINRRADEEPETPRPAAVCVYPNFAALVSRSLEAEETAVACVAGGFPSGQMASEVKSVEVMLALNEGATEIDTVLPVGKLLSGDLEGIADELGEMKAACGERKLKVILETGALPTARDIKRAALAAIYSGADFIKTSTGKIQPGATPAAAYVMCQTIREYFEKTGTRIGFKAAGGISTIEDALTYYTLVRELLGEEWLTPELFRIGTSRLF